MGIRRYLYISDTKIDIWLPQVPLDSARKITAQLGFNIGVLKGKIETQRDAKTAPADRVSKCQILEKYIVDKEEVGSPESGNLWIAGTVHARVFPIKYSAVLFISSLSAKTLVLTGSSRYLIGSSSMVEITPKYLPSFGYSVVRMLGEMAEEQVTSQNPAEIEEAVESTVSRAEDPAWVRTLRQFEETTEQPMERVAFLATKLLPPYQMKQGRQYEVYSPLFVESVDGSFKA
jgi:uncharacterized protein DUF7019